MEYAKDNFIISTDKSRLDLDVIANFLQNSYWAKDRPLEIIEKSIEGSICFGVYDNKEQIGFARVTTDKATFAWLADVFILEEYRGKGLSKWFIETVLNYPELLSISRWMLATKDAHSLYKKFGFTDLKSPDQLMEKSNFNL